MKDKPNIMGCFTVCANLLVLFILIEEIYLIFMEQKTQISGFQNPTIQGFSKSLPFFDQPIAFAVVWIGYPNITNKDRIKRCLVALEQTMPGAKITIITNCYTEVDPSILTDYNLWVNIDYSPNNVTREEVDKLYPYDGNFWTWFGVYRYKFYVDYLEKHSEYENMLFMDVDTLLLKNPMDLIYQENPNYIHMMNDYWKYRRTSDFNFVWFRNYYNFMQNSNRSLICNVPHLNYPLYSKEFLDYYPINAGLMFGKTTEILKLCRLLANVSLCIGMFQGGCEQSLINYVYHNGMINKTGVIIRAHHMN